MTLNQIRHRAQQMGLKINSRMRKADLIWAIQYHEGNNTCFGADWRFDCPQYDCCWREDCLKPRPT